jgi:hypothetical protein
MEFFIFLCFMSFVSFAVAFLAYGLVIRLMGTTSSASRYSQIILVPIAIILHQNFKHSSAIILRSVPALLHTEKPWN